MGRETDELLDHDYDGIKEYDNPLPRWWLGILYGAIIFAVIYYPYYHFGPGKLPKQEYEIAMIEWELMHPPVELKSSEEIAEMAKDAAFLAAGKTTFEIRCAACHLKDGGGLVGPNLTDDFSIHGQDLGAMAKVVYEGVPAKGMIAWSSQLSVDEIYQVTAYAHSLRGTTPEKPKAPQGDPIGDAVAAADEAAPVGDSAADAAPPAGDTAAPAGDTAAPTQDTAAPAADSAAPAAAAPNDTAAPADDTAPMVQTGPAPADEIPGGIAAPADEDLPAPEADADQGAASAAG